MINEESVITAGERNVGRALLLKHDPNMDEATKQQQWADVTSFMLADEFDDEKQKILETYKQDDFEGQPVSKKIFTGRKMAQLMGVKDMPVMYFKNQGLAVPENAKEDKDLFMAIYDNELPKMREAKIGQQKREAEIFAKQQQIERASVEYVQGKGFAKLADLVEFSDNPEEGIKTLERANKAFKVIEQVALDDDGKWMNLDNFSRNDAVRLNTILGGDEYAFGLLTEALNNEAEAQGLDSVEFFGGIKRGLNKLAMNAGDYLANKSMIGGDMVDVGSGTMVDANSSPDVMEAFLDLFRSDKKASQKPADFTQDDARQIDSLMGLISNYEEQMTKTKKDAAWWVKGLNGAGRMVGDSAIYMMPHTGVQMAVVNELGKATNQSALLNEGPLGIFKNASRNILEEKAFGVFSVFGKFGTINAALKKLNNSKLVNLAAKAPVRSFVEGTKTGKAMFAIGGEWAEEMVMENLVGMTYEQAAGRIFKLLDNSVQVEKFEPLKQIWESIKDPEESVGCALFVGMMTSSRFGSLKKEVAQYVSSVDRARAAGFTKSHAQELAGIKDIEKRADRAQELFNLDVLGDIEGATKRAQEAGRELIEKEEAQWHQASGVVEKALTDRGIAKIETMPGGEKCLITMEEKDGEEAQTKELTVDQTASLIRVAISDAKLEGIRSMQSRLMGDALSESADRTQYMDVLDMYGESAPQEYQRDAKNKAGITLKGMQSLAERAKARIDYIMNEESISYDEAAVKSDGSVMNGVALGSVAQLGSAMEKRLDIAVKSGEITRKQADLMKEGYVPVSEVHRMGKAGDPASSIVMVARGEASAENILEDVHESALVNMVAQGKTTWEKLWDGLKGMETELKAYGVHLGLTDGKPSQMDVIEAFSKLSLADFIANVDDMNISQNAKNLVNYSIRQLESGAYLTQVADAYSEYESSLEEPQDGDLAEMLKAVGLETQSLFNSMKFNAEVNQAKIQLWMDRAAERQANHDGRLSADEQGVVLEEAEAQDKLEEEIEQGRDESVEPDPSPIIMDHQGEVMAIGDNALVDDKRGKGLVGGRFIEGNGFIVGYVETSALSLAPDVEQFKEGEKSKFGAIKGKELSGEFDPNTDPISVWRRIDGSLQVITGRHRYDLAKRNGVEAMQARVYEENDVYNVQWAKLHDIRKNIMDNQATPLEVAFFVRNSGISKADMKAQGLLRGGSSAVLGYDIAILACDEVFTRLKNGDITAQQAFNIVHASNTEKGQTIALKLIKEGKPLEYVNSYCREADRIISEDSLNLFGDDESWIKDCEKVADYVSKSVALINARLGILNKSNGLKRNIKSAEKMGITLETPDDIKSRIEELEMLKIDYQRHDSRLRIHQSAMEWDGKSELDPFEYIERIGEEVNPDQMGFSFSIKSVNIEADAVVSSASEMRAKLKPLQGKVFVNKNTGIQAVIEARVSGKTVGKAGASQMSVANLKALGYSVEEARKIHYTAATRIHELFENAPDAFFEESYKGDSARAGAYHLFNSVEIEGIGSFDVNVTAISFKEDKSNTIYTLELTIENPATRGATSQKDRLSTPSKDGVSIDKLASYRSFVEKEMRDIKTKAQDDGTYLKAPNGEETKLNEKQWLQVRTKAFKEWFGDWENDAENASKVVDENGEPMVVYHVTDGDFNVFDFSNARQSSDIPAMFFSSGSEDWADMGGNVMSCFINVRKPTSKPIVRMNGAEILEKLKADGFDGTIEEEDGMETEYSVFSPTQIKSATNNRGTFDGENPDITFSLSGGKSIWDAAYMAELDNRIDNLNKTIRKSIEQWNVVCSNKRAKTSDLAKAYGEAMARVSAVYKVLPEGFRFAMHPYMNAVKNHMEKMEGAKGTLSKEELVEKAQDVMESLLKRTQDQLRKYTKARMMRDLNDTLKRVKPKKNKSGKLKGKMDAEHYRRLGDVERMMNASSEEKQNRLDELQGLIENLTDEDTKEADAYKVELMDWAVFGCWKDMGIDEARGAFNSAMDFIMEGRLKWEEKLKVNKLKNKRKAEIIVDSLGVPDKNEQAAAPGKTVGMMSAVKTAMTYGMKSYAQTLDAIGAKSDEMRAMMDTEIVAISEANVRLGMMKNQREREVDELIARVTGIKSATKRKKWLIGFKKAHETGIDLYPKGWKTKQLTIDDARRLVNMTKDQREAERKKITKDYHKQGMSSRDAIVDEVAIPYFEEKINELDGLSTVPKNRKYLTVRYEVNTNEVTKNLKVSKAQAMYTILLSEQKEYAENLESDGVNQDVLNQLREYVGEDGIQFGYGLREIMNRQGELLAEVFEIREGVPFPRVENYFRATFKITHKQNEGKTLETNGMGNGGAKYGMLIARRKHNLDLAWDTDCVSVFKASSAEVDNYIVSGDITSRWRGILSDRQAAKSIESRVGVNGLKSLKEWVNIIEGAGAIQGNIELAHSQTVSRLQGAKAVALLAYNLPTLLKQVSALRHGYYAGDVSWARFLVHLSGAMIGQGRMNAKQMMNRDAFKARQEYDRALDEIMGYAEGQNYSAVANFAMCGMGYIEKMDVWSNAITMTALYNAKWSDMEKINEGSDIKMSEEEMDNLCMQAVQSALELGAQPLTATQKSLMGNNNTAGSKVLCFMGSEVVNKYGLVLDLIEKGNWGKALMMVVELSLIEQSIMMMYNYLLDDDEEWKKRGGFESYAIGAPMAFLGGIPALGSSIEAIYNRMTGQRIYIGTSSAVFDVGSFFTSWKKTYEAIMGKRDKRGRLVRRNLSTEDWFNIISNDIKTAAFGVGAFRGSQSKLADGIASWILSAAASMNLAKPGVKLADKYGE